MRRHLFNFFKIGLLCLIFGVPAFSQTAAQIYQAATPASNPMDPNGDGWISADGLLFTVSESPLEIGFIGMPQVNAESSGDLRTGGTCGSTEIVDNPGTGADASYVFYDDPDGIPDNGDEIMIYRLRLAQDASGAFGFSVLVDTDGCFGNLGGGCPQDPNSVAGNVGFEYEIRYKAGGGGAGVYVDDVDGTTSGTNISFYAESTNVQRSYALFNDAACAGQAVFYDFFVPIADMGLTSASQIRLAAGTASAPGSILGGASSDIAGVDDGLPAFADEDDAFVALIALQDPTPVGNLGSGGCFVSGTSDTPVIDTPIFDSDIQLSGTSTEADGADVIVKMDGNTLGTTTVTSNAWSISFARGTLRPFSSTTATVQDPCEYESAEATGVIVINDLDSDNDGILDMDEGNGLDPGGDDDGDKIANYLDTDYLGFVDSNSDGVNDNFDNDLDGVPNHFDLDSDNDGVPDITEAGGAALDANNDGILDAPLDTDQDGIPDVIDSDNGGTPLDNPDSDGDGVADAYDRDGDGDGLTDIFESGGTDADNDGIIDGFVDADGDGLNDALVGSPLPDKDLDTDGDGVVNSKDVDSDGDGIPEIIEVQTTAGYTAPLGVDSDGDGIDDAYDVDTGTPLSPVNTDGLGDGPDYLDSDSDEDGVPDSIEGNDANLDGVADISASGTDSDGDGLDDNFDTTPVGPGNSTGSNYALQNSDGVDNLDFRDTDDDNDGILTSVEDFNTNLDWSDDLTQGGGIFPDYLYNGDYDGDTVPDASDLDSDNDGILDANEDGGTGFDPTGDADGDGTLNYVDASDITAGFPAFTDSNADGINDAYDYDLDGIPDFQDLDIDGDGIVDLIEAGGVDAD